MYIYMYMYIYKYSEMVLYYLNPNNKFHSFEHLYYTYVFNRGFQTLASVTYYQFLYFTKFIES